MGGKARPWCALLTSVRSSRLLPGDLSAVGLTPHLCPSALAQLPERGTWTSVGYSPCPGCLLLDSGQLQTREGLPGWMKTGADTRSEEAQLKGTMQC